MFMIVPYQDNGWDCGVFVCRYAFGILCLREKKFALKAYRDHTVKKKHMKALLEIEITKSDEFNFNMDDISRLRKEFADLIDKLSDMYREKEKLRIEHKRRAKESRLGTKMSNKGGIDV